MSTDKYDLHTIDYSVQGWDSVLATDMEKLDDIIHSRIEATAGETIAQYDAVYLEADEKYDKALADGTQQPSVGLAFESATLDDEFRIQRIGPITNAGWAWATVGVKVYLDTSTPGALTDVKPGSNAQMMGFALSATSIFIWVDPMEVASGGVPGAHKDSHDPEDGSDPLDCAAPSELAGVQAAAEGSSHSFARADHVHQIQHGIADNHIVTIDQADAASGEYVRATINGIETRSKAEAQADLDIKAGALENIVEDASPQLGGHLDQNGFGIIETITSHSATENVTAVTMYGGIHKITGAHTLTLPSAVVGMGGIFRASTATAFSLDCNAADHFELFDGTVLANGNKITSSGIKNGFVTLYCEVANTWIIIGENGTFTDGG